MCGITGIYNFDPDNNVDKTILNESNEVLTHRGPDDDGIYTHGPIGMGMRRLSIIDVAGGKQPIGNEDL